MTKEEVLKGSESVNYVNGIPVRTHNVSKAMDQYYNQAIGDALAIVKKWWKADAPNVTHLKSNLEALKKNQQ
jgi:hypothetical protein